MYCACAHSAHIIRAAGNVTVLSIEQINNHELTACAFAVLTLLMLEPADTDPPTLICPADRDTIYAEPGERTAVVTYPDAQAVDASDIDRSKYVSATTVDSAINFNPYRYICYPCVGKS